MEIPIAPSKSAHTPNFRASLGQVCLGGLGVGEYGGGGHAGGGGGFGFGFGGFGFGQSPHALTRVKKIRFRARKRARNVVALETIFSSPNSNLVFLVKKEGFLLCKGL